MPRLVSGKSSLSLPRSLTKRAKRDRRARDIPNDDCTSDGLRSAPMRSRSSGQWKETKCSRYSPRFSLSFLLIIAGCSSAKPPFAFRGPEPMNASDRAMALLAERYLDASLKLSPVNASYVGYHKWDHLLPDLSKAGIERAIHTLEYFQDELRKIDRKALSTSWAIDHE